MYIMHAKFYFVAIAFQVPSRESHEPNNNW